MLWRSGTTIVTGASPAPRRGVTGLRRFPGGIRLPLDVGSGRRRSGLRMIGEVAAICRGVSGFSYSLMVSLPFPQPSGHLRSVRLLKTLLTLFTLEPLVASFLLLPLIDLGDCRFRRIADIGSTMF